MYCHSTNSASGGVACIVTLQTLLVGRGCSLYCHFTNSASGGGGVACIFTLQTLLVGEGV